MKKTLQVLLFCITTLLFSCSSTKTTKVYIEVGVNDYTKTKTNMGAVSGSSTKTKGLDTGVHQRNSADSNVSRQSIKRQQ